MSAAAVLRALRGVHIVALGWLVLLLASPPSHAQAPKNCTQLPRAIAAPRDGLVYQGQLLVSSAAQPAVVDFYSAEQFVVTVNLQRLDRGGSVDGIEPPIVDLVVSLHDAGAGRLEEKCRIEGLVLPRPFRTARFFVHSDEAAVRNWRVELRQRGSESTHSHPEARLALGLHVSRYPPKSLLASDAFGSGSDADVDLQCSRGPARLEAVQRRQPKEAALTLGPGDSSRIIYVRSIGPVDVHFDAGQASTPSAQAGAPMPTIRGWPEVRLTVKRASSPYKYSAACLETIGSIGDVLSGSMRATVQSRRGSADETWLWRIEIFVPDDVDRSAHFRLAYDEPALPSTGDAGALQCTEPMADRTGLVTANERMFAGATTLTIGLVDMDQGLTSKGRQEVVEHLLAGMGIWRPVCFMCVPDQLAVANIGRERYVVEPLVPLLEAFYGGRLEYPPGIASLDRYAQLVSSINSRSIVRGPDPATRYVRLPTGSRGVAALCADRASDRPPAVRRLQIALDCPGADPLSEPTYRQASANLVFRGPPFDGCPANEDTIACESSALKIELNTRDYAFFSDSTRETVVGKGRKPVSLLHVLVHEIGHWMGIGHLSQSGSIMNETMTEARCVDTMAMQAMNMLAAGVSFPVTKPMAFSRGRSPATRNLVPKTY